MKMIPEKFYVLTILSKKQIKRGRGGELGKKNSKPKKIKTMKVLGNACSHQGIPLDTNLGHPISYLFPFSFLSTFAMSFEN